VGSSRVKKAILQIQNGRRSGRVRPGRHSIAVVIVGIPRQRYGIRLRLCGLGEPVQLERISANDNCLCYHVSVGCFREFAHHHYHFEVPSYEKHH
ncbi:unnamed protein product, partial [Nesidiocoris tenuis]